MMATAVPALAADGVAADATRTSVVSGAGATTLRTTSEPSAQRVPITQDAFTVIQQATAERERIRKQQAERAERARKAKIRKAKIAAAKKERARKAAIRKARAQSWVWPTASGSVSTRFGVSGSLWSSGRHTGVDFRGNSGDTVRTVHTGVVIFAGSDGAYGNHVKVRHSGGHETWYAHLSSISVRAGQRVISGDQLGRMGSTGNSTGPHLHFEVHRGGAEAASEPMSFLRDRGLG
jgi:murein DD-endopeptidase MepM/ murein hydrolase activator NlpD